MEQNPRKGIPDKEMEDFLEFAKDWYRKFGVVNMTHLENEEDEEIDEEVKHYISESMEALLLFKAFLEDKEDKEAQI